MNPQLCRSCSSWVMLQIVSKQKKFFIKYRQCETKKSEWMNEWLKEGESEGSQNHHHILHQGPLFSNQFRCKPRNEVNRITVQWFCYTCEFISLYLYTSPLFPHNWQIPSNIFLQYLVGLGLIKTALIIYLDLCNSL